MQGHVLVRIGAKLIEEMGAESLMWGSGYPHGDGVWPNSDQYIKEPVRRGCSAAIHRENEQGESVARVETCDSCAPGRLRSLASRPQPWRTTAYVQSDAASPWCRGACGHDHG